MTAKAGYQDVDTDLAQSLQKFWDAQAGICPTRVQVVSGEGAVVVWQEEILSPAERRMVSTEEVGKQVQELELNILELASPQLQRVVQGAAGQESKLAGVHLDLQNGGVLGFFQLD